MNSWEELSKRYSNGVAAPAEDDWGAISKRVQRTVRGEPEKPKAEPVTDFSGNLRFGSVDTGVALPEWLNKRLAQFGSGVADYKTRLDQVRGNATEADVDEKRRIDAELEKAAPFGGAVKFAGRVLPAMALPMAGSAPVLSGVLAGTAAGAAEPVGTGESALANTVLGGALGAAIPGVVGGVRHLLKPNAATAASAQKAASLGIPVGAADLSSNAAVRAARSITNDIPIAGMSGRALRDAQQAGLNKAVGGAFGSPSAKLMPDVVDAAKSRMGGEFDRLWKQNNLEVDSTVFRNLQDLRAAAADLPKAQAQRVISQIDDFWSRAQPGQNGAPVISGEVANNFQKWLRTQAKPNSALEHEFSTMRKEIIGAFNRSISPDDAAALTLNRSQYKAFKTVEPLLDKGVVGTAGRAEGDIPASLLSEAVRKNYSGLSSQTDRPALADIAQVASRFMVDRVPQTGGSARAMLQNAGLLGISGGGLGLAAGLGAPAGVAIGGAGALGLNSLLNSQALAKSLLGGGASRNLLGPSSPALASKEALLLGLQRSPLALASLFGSPALEQ